jgi:FKBP-type peptidyl-prolyl cis-trans isomerase 2
MRSFSCLLCVVLSCAGCAKISNFPPAATVLPGDTISIEYTCKTPDGELAATTDKTVAENPSQSFSSLFAPLNNYLPACEKVPDPKQCPPLNPKMGYEEMLEKLIARQASGAPYNRLQVIPIAGELIPGVSGGDRYLLLNRAIKQDRVESMSIERFEGVYGATPVIGIKFDSPKQPGISVTVDSMEGDEVTILSSAEPGTVLPSPFGPQVVTQARETLEFRIDSTVGDIIRSSGMVGKVSKVDNETIEIDYGHSSGFIPLTCEVTFKPLSSPDGLGWYDNPEDAKEESRRTGKPLLIHLHDQWSKPCREYLAKVLPDPKVIDALNGYVRVRINSFNQLETLAQYGVTTLPTILLYDSHGALKSTITGLTTAEKLAEELQKNQVDTK